MCFVRCPPTTNPPNQNERILLGVPPPSRFLQAVALVALLCCCQQRPSRVVHSALYFDCTNSTLSRVMNALSLLPATTLSGRNQSHMVTVGLVTTLSANHKGDTRQHNKSAWSSAVILGCSWGFGLRQISLLLSLSANYTADLHRLRYISGLRCSDHKAIRDHVGCKRSCAQLS